MTEDPSIPPDYLLLKKPLDEMGLRELSALCRLLTSLENPTPEQQDLYLYAVDELVSLDMSMGMGRREMARRAAEAQTKEQDA